VAQLLASKPSRRRYHARAEDHARHNGTPLTLTDGTASATVRACQRLLIDEGDRST